MNAVFLDFATIGADVLDPRPLKAVAPQLALFDSTEDGQIVERIQDAEFVLTNKVRLGASELRAASKLRFIGLTATGTDNVDLDYAREHGIAVSNIRAYCTRSVVEHVFAVLLNLTHSILRYDRSVRSGEWQSAESFCMLKHPIRELSAMTMGVVGYGELGRSVAAMAAQFGMQVLIARRPGRGVAAGDGRVDFADIVADADVISLHCPLTDKTRGMFGRAEFQRMKSDALLINTARGGLIDTTALAAALARDEIGGAAIDVLPQEPPVDGDPLLDYDGDNLIMTPHIAWATAEARQNAIDELAANLRAFLEGEMRNRVV